jgi:Protein of unknown function (DUF3619)
MTAQRRHADQDLLVSRAGARLAAGLSERAADLPQDISERLRVAREQAVARARHVQRQASAPLVSLQGGTAALGGPDPWWQRLASLLPLLVLAAGLMLVGQWTTREQVLAATDIDAILLSDEVPPDAYADPGFAEFLKSAPP